MCSSCTVVGQLSEAVSSWLHGNIMPEDILKLFKRAVLPHSPMFRCCNKMGSSSAKLDKKMIIDEASPFHSKNNPMNARANSVRSIKR